MASPAEVEPFTGLSASMLGIGELEELIKYNLRSGYRKCIASKVKAMDAVDYRIDQCLKTIRSEEGAISLQGPEKIKFKVGKCEVTTQLHVACGDSPDRFFLLMRGKPTRISGKFKDTNIEHTWYDLRIEEDGGYYFGAENWSCRIPKEDVGPLEVSMMCYFCLLALKRSDVMFPSQVNDARMVEKCTDVHPKELTPYICESNPKGVEMIRRFAKAGLGVDAFLMSVQHAFDIRVSEELDPMRVIYKALWIPDDPKAGPAPGYIPEGLSPKFVSAAFHGLVTRIWARDEDCNCLEERKTRQNMIWLLENIDVLRTSV